MAFLLEAPPVLAGLLDESPKLYTFKLDDPAAPRLPLLDAFRNAAVDPAGGVRRYLWGKWGQWRARPWWAFRWQLELPEKPPESLDEVSLGEDRTEPLYGFAASSPRVLQLTPEVAPNWLNRLDPALDLLRVPTTGLSFRSNGFDALWSLPPKKPIPDWRCRRRPVRIARYGGESDRFLLVHCNGAVAVEAYDRLTLMAREAGVPRPGALLPDEPDALAVARGEWVAGVRPVFPRLLWVVQQIADAFPWRTIYIYSGYRHDPENRVGRSGTHHSMHSEARALDVAVIGIPNVALFQFCRTLTDVGCGFYPNNRFVHLDVRGPGAGHPLWIDISSPGEPSHYVGTWPGVVDDGARVAEGREDRSERVQPDGGSARQLAP